MDDETPKPVKVDDSAVEVKLNNSNQFWELFKQSVIMQALLSVMMCGTYCYLVIAGKPISQEFYLLLGVIVGFFFGGKMGMAQGQAAERAKATS